MNRRIGNIITILVVATVHSSQADDLPDLDTPALGVKVVAVADALDAFKDDKIELPTKIGVILVHVESHGPAANASLRRMDVVTRVNRQLMRTTEDFTTAVSLLTIGKEYVVEGYRATDVRGKISWTKGKVKVSPVSLRDVFVNAMREKKDDVSGITSYRHRDTTEFVNSRSEVYCYFLTSTAAKPSLRFHVQYVADDWLFIKRFTLKADEETFTLNVAGIRDVERDNSGGKIWEWHDRPVGSTERRMLNVIAKSKRVLLRCEGDQYKKDRELSDTELDRIRTVLIAYQIMGGE